jgi:cobalt-zinc-cadmium efflux system outer membrane protein
VPNDRHFVPVISLQTHAGIAMKNLSPIIIVCVLVELSSAVGRAETVTLSQAQQIALTQNPGILAERKRVEAISGRALQSRLWQNPEIEFSAEDVPVENGGLSRSKTMVGITQTVPFPGKKSLDGQIGRQDVIAAEAEYWRRERELLRDVTIAFYAALAAQKKASVSAELVALAQSLVDATRKRVVAGAAGDQEALRAEIELDRAQLEAAAAQRELMDAQRQLARWLATPSEPSGELPEKLPAQARILSQTPLKAAEAARTRAELELRRAKLEPLPDVKVGVAGGRDQAANETLMEFRVSVPLPLFDRAQGRERETRALAEISRLDQTAMQQRLAQEWDTAIARLESAQSAADAYRIRILPRTQEALRLVRQGYEAGKFGFLDLLDTQRTASEAQLAYYDKLLELNTAAAELTALASE